MSQDTRAFCTPCLYKAENVARGSPTSKAVHQEKGSRMDTWTMPIEQLLHCPGETGGTTEGTVSRQKSHG